MLSKIIDTGGAYIMKEKDNKIKELEDKISSLERTVTLLFEMLREKEGNKSPNV